MNQIMEVFNFFKGFGEEIYNLLETYGSLLLEAMGSTLLLALLGLFFGCILGIIFGMASVVKNKFANTISTIYVNIIRGIPMIVLAFFVFYGVPFGLKSIGIKAVFTGLQAGTICLALNCGAYMSEIIRAGIQAIDKGQMEAARSLGLPYWRSMFKVVLPQAIKNMIPSIVNQFIITLKDTSILSVIGFPELVNKAQNVIAITFKSFQMWAIVAIMYLVVILLLQQLAKALERRLSRGR